MKISVIICTYNREQFLPECFEHLKNQDAKAEDFEVLIVNNKSTDNTKQISQEFIKNHPELNIRYVEEHNAGLSFARNCGIENAQGDILCFIDDDGFAAPSYVTTVKSVASNPAYSKYVAFGGKVIPRYNPGKDPKWLTPYLEGLVSKLDMGESRIPFTKKYPVGCNMVFRKEFFEEHGGFNTDLHTRSDEKFVFDKLKKASLDILYIPELEVEHFMDDFRLEKEFIIRLSKIIGQSESIRLKNSGFPTRFMKVIEYIFKWGASLILALPYLFKGEPIKSKYLVMVRWNVLKGFFISKKL